MLASSRAMTMPSPNQVSYSSLMMVWSLGKVPSRLPQRIPPQKLNTAKEAVWMKNYIQELRVVPSIGEPMVIFYDNNGTIAQAKEPRSHHGSKHILRRYHLLREMVSRGDVRMD
ncbi:UNVERIFIED_CONTAM: hypothetical protein Slati_4227200 [Sesamum latifolium]|uniref:Uncharacterized protein n=1 Tax=Sesamum latifolium TaxID=2727402 RepID=A0AAW2TCX7_9LAMI